jgi:hypothetical protein
MDRLNSSWYNNGDPTQGLNPRIALVNTNTDEENRQLLAWAGERMQLADLEDNDGQIRRDKIEHRSELAKALAYDLDFEAYDCSLRGFGTLKEHKLYDQIYRDAVKSYCEANKESIAYENEMREQERRQDLIDIGIDPDRPWACV